MKIVTIKRVLISVFVVLLILLSLLTGIVVVYFVSFYGEMDNDSREFNFQTLEYDPSTNKTSVGFCSMPEPLSEGSDFFHYEDLSTGKHNLISKYGSREFICHGTCFCDQNNERRSLSSFASIGSKGLVYLLVGLTSLVAYERAGKYFSERCNDEFSEICSSPSEIRSEVDECTYGYVSRNEYEDDLRDMKDGVEHYEETVFVCKGTCINQHNEKIDINFGDSTRINDKEFVVPDRTLEDIRRLYFKTVEDEECHLYSISSSTMTLKDLRNFGDDHNPEVIMFMSTELLEDYATFVFAHEELDRFCQKSSRKRVNFPSPFGEEVVALCSGQEYGEYDPKTVCKKQTSYVPPEKDPDELEYDKIKFQRDSRYN